MWHETAPKSCSPDSAPVRPLAALHKGARGTVDRVLDEDASAEKLGDVRGSTLARRLIELGFVPGETLEVIAEVRPGGDPIVVRIGSSMFALRRREAEAVLVHVAAPEAVEERRNRGATPVAMAGELSE